MRSLFIWAVMIGVLCLLKELNFRNLNDSMASEMPITIHVDEALIIIMRIVVAILAALLIIEELEVSRTFNLLLMCFEGNDL